MVSLMCGKCGRPLRLTDGPKGPYYYACPNRHVNISLKEKRCIEGCVDALVSKGRVPSSFRVGNISASVAEPDGVVYVRRH